MARKRQRLFRYAVDTFIELLQQVTKRRVVNYRCNNSDVSAWNYFTETFPDHIGEEFVLKFLEYGIQSWFNSGTERDYSKSVRFSWIFGKPAINRWKKNSIETNVHITRIGLKRDHKINTKTRRSELSKIVTSLRPVEENAKAEYHNTRRGFLWCISNTTLYFHKSSKCATCIHKKDCKELLKKEYLKVYLKRGYGE